MPTTLAAGDIAILGLNADNPDSFSFVLLTAVTSGTEITFTDSGVTAAGAFRGGEGAVRWTAAGDLAAGTVVNFTSPIAAPFTSGNDATVGTNGLSLSTDGDQIIAFQGPSTSPTFLYALTTNDDVFGDATSSQTTAVPPGLVENQTAIARGKPAPATGEFDNARYNGPTSGTKAELLSAIGDRANWIGDDNPTITQATANFTVTGSGGGGAPTVISLTVDDNAKPEGESFTFTVTLSAPAAGDTVVTLAATGATADLAAPPASVTVLNGQTTATFTVATVEDAVTEANEGFTITATLGGSSQAASATIENDDAAATTVLGGVTILLQAESLAGSTTTPTATNTLNMYREATVISGDLDGDGVGTGAGGAESIAFDPFNDRAFVTNAALDRIDIISLANPGAPANAGFIDLVGTLAGFSYGNVNSVAVRNGVVAVAVQNADGGEAGIVALYDGGTGALIKTIVVGVLPDQLTFSPDGSLLVVANEGERFYDRSGPTPVVENAPGTITIISVPANPADAVVRNTVGFSALDAFEAELDALGVKTLDATTAAGVAIPDSSVSEDLEPEYVAISPDGRKAYVTLQEANAVAVIDLTNGTATSPTQLLPLGFVDFSLAGNEADFSDRDGASGAPSISVGNGPIKSLLQPDAIATFSVGGATYFITANEGDSRILSDATLGDPALNEARASSLTNPDDPDYARLNVDTVWSSATDLYGFGGRGFSIFRQNGDGTIVKVEETGGDIEQIVAALPNAATVFNGENGGGFDTRSDNKGAEPEGVAVGEVNGVPYAFVALERVGGVMVWDLSDPTDAKFVRYIAPTAQEYGPEVIRFVSAADSPNGRALVITANEVSGSVSVFEATTDTRISEIQGAGTASAMVGRTVTVEAIVTGDFQNGDADAARNLGGFYVQEELADADGNPLTSEGIFINQGALSGDVQIGDRVRVTGTVVESSGNTELNATSVSVVQAGAVADIDTLAVDVDLPSAGVILVTPGTASANPVYQPNLEAFEGMLVRFPEVLTLTEQFDFDRLGEVRLSADGRPVQFTETNDPSVAGYDASLREIAGRTITFDDGLNGTYQSLDNILTDGVYNTDTAPRMGDTVSGLTGILDYDFARYRVRAVESGVGVNDFVEANPRPLTPPDVGGQLKIGSFNVLNFFRTLDDGSTTANGFEPRGAETAAEFGRQTDKLVNALSLLDADVLGLIELENNFLPGASGNAIEFLVGELNTLAGFQEYAWINPGQQFVGGDAIAVGFIYKPSVVQVSMNTTIEILDDSDVDPALLAQSTVGGIFNGVNTSRAALAVSFTEVASGGEFTAVVNHFKSKSGNGTDADANGFDGAGAWNNQRELAAEALVDFLAGDPTGAADPDVVILGDLNAYSAEDPIDILKAAGYTDQGFGGYGYVFDGQIGSLDHVLTSASLTAQTTGAAEWHINADEADALDYNLNLDSDAADERDPTIFAPAIPARVSDHDPLSIGLQLSENPVPVDYTLQLLHLADGEAGLLASSTAKNLAALVDAFDDDYANTLILAGGDTYLPGPFLAAGTDLSVTPTLNAVSGSTIASNANIPIGAVDTVIHNVIGVEVSAIGNHEFDLGSRAFRDSFTPNAGAAGYVGANYALVSGNLDFSGDADLAPRFTNTVGNGATATPEASTLKGRIAPAVVVTKGGETIGIVGATTQILESISSPSGTEVNGFPKAPGPNGEVDDMALLASQLQPIIDELRAEGIDKIILQAHLQSIANEQQLATLLKGVDIILAAGSNTRLGDADDEAVAFPGHAANFANTYPIVVADADGNNTLIVNTDNEYTYLGRLKVDFDVAGNIIVDNLAADRPINGAYASTDANVAEAWGTTVANLETTAFADGTKGDKVRDLTTAVQNVINVKDGNVFGFTDVYLEGERSIIRSEETNLGNLSADANAFALREALNLGQDTVVVSFKNGGGIRAQIGTLSAPDPTDGSVDKLPPPANPATGKPEGGISQLDIENSLRFNNGLMAFDTTASGLKAILEHGVAAGGNQGRFPQIGGVAFSYDPDLPAGSRVLDIALVDEDGDTAFSLYDDGEVQVDAPASITVITLNFLANGGDGYPTKANGSNFRYLRADGTLSAPVDESLNFTDAGVIAANTMGSSLLGEQQAFGEYVQEVYGTPARAYDEADTPASLDQRTQNLNVKTTDTVLVGVDFDGTAASDNQGGTGGKDSLDGAGGNDQLFGRAGRDSLNGGGGDDFLNGGTGIDTLIGGGGDDRFLVDNAADIVTELVGGGLDSVVASVSFTLSAEVEFLFLDGAASDGTGNAGANSLYGTDLANTLSGLGADDRLLGLGGNDILLGGDGADRHFGGTGADLMRGGAGDDLYLADASDMVDETDGAGGDAGGIDTVQAGFTATLSQFVENLTLIGSAAIDGSGNAGANRVVGNEAANRLSGFGGADTLVGRGGADIFVFDTAPSAGNADRINDFSVADDSFEFDLSVFTALTAGPDGTHVAAADFSANAANPGDANLIYSGATGRLFYDADGSGAGASVLVATLSRNLALTADDFLVA